MNPSAAPEATASQVRDSFTLRAKHGPHELAGISDFSTASTGTGHLASHAFQASPEVAACAAAVAWRRASSISRDSVLTKWLAPTWI